MRYISIIKFENGTSGAMLIQSFPKNTQCKYSGVDGQINAINLVEISKNQKLFLQNAKHKQKKS